MRIGRDLLPPHPPFCNDPLAAVIHPSPSPSSLLPPPPPSFPGTLLNLSLMLPSPRVTVSTAMPHTPPTRWRKEPARTTLASSVSLWPSKVVQVLVFNHCTSTASLGYSPTHMYVPCTMYSLCVMHISQASFSIGQWCIWPMSTTSVTTCSVNTS